MEVISAKDAPKFWTLRDGNHNSFPRVPIGSSDKPLPLRAGGDKGLLEVLGKKQADDKEQLDAFRKLYKTSALELKGLVPWPSYRDRLQKRLHDLEQLRETDAKAVLFLLDRVLSTDGAELLKTLDSALERAIQETPDVTLVTLAAQVLFIGAGEVLLDIGVDADFPRTSCDPRNMGEITDVLNQSAQGGAVGRCALTGQLVRVEDDKFPQPTLPVIGPTYLYSKNTDIPCASRYKRAGPEGFPVSRDLLSRLQATAETLAAEERKGRTWSRVPSEKPKQYDLLLAFIPLLNDLQAAAGMAEDEAAFEELASRLIEIAQGQYVGFSEQARIVVLRRVDPGNRKVIFSTTSAVKDLAAAASRWTEGCRNTPDIRLLVPHGKSKPAEDRGPGRIAPGNLVALGREVFTRDGKERQEAPGPTFTDAMRLFLGREFVRGSIARRLLPLYLTRRGPLVAGMAHSSRRGDRKDFDAKGTLDTISVLGLLLNELARKKEGYMNDVAFQLGQLLAGADVLHRGFCEHQRGGSIPSALLGNQALALAQRSPVAALNMLCNRWRVYAGWAEKNRASAEIPSPELPREEKDRAWAVYQGVTISRKLRPLAQSLHGCALPDRADNRFRAEMLLGYIAGSPTSITAPKDSSTSLTIIAEED